MSKPLNPFLVDNRPVPAPNWASPFHTHFWTDVVDMACDPAGTSGRLQDRPVGELLAIPLLGFSLLFSQTLSELMLTRRWQGYLLGLVVGLLFGWVVVPTVSYILAFIMRACGLTASTPGAFRVVSASYSGTLIYALAALLVGLVTRMATAGSFGMVGVAWAFTGMIHGLRERGVPRIWALVGGLAAGVAVLLAWLTYTKYVALFAAKVR
jgi:hypothetical protein